MDTIKRVTPDNRGRQYQSEILARTAPVPCKACRNLKTVPELHSGPLLLLVTP